MKEDEFEDETNNDSIAPEQDNDNDTIEQQPTISNQLSNGEIPKKVPAFFVSVKTN